MGPRFVVVETLTSGAGLEIIAAARRRAARVAFLTRDRDRYLDDPHRGMLDDGSVEVHVCETRSADAVAAVLTESRRAGPFTLIAPNEQYLLPAAAAAERLGIPFPPVAAVRLVQDKHEFRTVCAGSGIPAPRSRAAPDVGAALAGAARIGYPVVLKPSIGTGSYGVVSATDAAQVRAHFPKVLAECTAPGAVPLVEEFAVGPVVSAEVLVADGTVHVLGISDRVMSPMPHFLELSVRFPVALDPATHTEITRSCTDLCELLDYAAGPAHIEFALTSAGPRVIEFNPRVAGRNVARMVAAALRWDLFGAIVDSHLGRRVTPPRPSGGAAEYALYAGRGGRFLGVQGVDLATRVPGVREVRITREPGSLLGAAEDQRAEYGSLWCTGATTDEAGMRAATAAGYLSPVFEDR